MAESMMNFQQAMAVNPKYPLTTVGALVKGPLDRILIVKTTKWKGAWGVPGGKVDWGETLEQALKREFREEVSLDLFNIEHALIQEAVLDSPDGPIILLTSTYFPEI